jgi:excisionase family DNA binding protein
MAKIEMNKAKPAAYPSYALTLADASAYIGVHRSTLYNLVAQGKLSNRHIGKRRVFLRAELEGLLVDRRAS